MSERGGGGGGGSFTRTELVVMQGLVGLLSHTGSLYIICSNALQAVGLQLLLVAKHHDAIVVSLVRHVHLVA